MYRGASSSAPRIHENIVVLLLQCFYLWPDEMIQYPLMILSLVIVPSPNGVFLLAYSTTAVSTPLVYLLRTWYNSMPTTPLFSRTDQFRDHRVHLWRSYKFVFLPSRHLALDLAHRTAIFRLFPTIRFGDAVSFAPVRRLYGVESGRQNVVMWHHLNMLFTMITPRHRFRCPLGHLCTRVFMFDVCCLVVAAAAG